MRNKMQQNTQSKIQYKTANKKNIFLIGFMGSGKTTVGLRLSYKLRIPVEDTDKLIEQREGRTIGSIFAKEGEPCFREWETELLRQIGGRNYGRVISAGGGTPTNPVNRSLMQEHGIVVYLRVRPETVYERLRTDTTRPLLQCEDPLRRIKELMEARKEAYEGCADIVIDTDELSMEEILDKILSGIKEIREREIMQMKILVINGPNINFLGIREKSVYGVQDYQYLLDLIAEEGRKTGSEISVFQSNHEGAIIDRIQEAYFDGTQAIIINPGAYTHYSYAIRDALASITVPKIEIHISDITNREEFRRTSVTAPVCDRQIYGQGLEGYLQAIHFVLERKI